MVPHPEVLSPEFVPPTLFGRERELEQLRRLLTPEGGAGIGSRCALVRGPAGSGTSSLVRVAARRVFEEARRSGPGESLVVVTLRAPAHRGTQGLAAELVRRLDEGFEPRGFHTMEMLAGFLRRLNRDGRSAVVVVDDVGPSAPDLSPIFRAFRQPDRFLPEGVETRISTWFLLAGRTEAASVWSQAERAGISSDQRIELSPYAQSELGTIVRDRAARAIGHAPSLELAERIAARAFLDGASAVRAVHLLRRELLGPEPRAAPSAAIARGGRGLLEVEPHLLDALESSLSDHPADLGELRVEEARQARTAGRRPLPATTLWRRLLRLESAGLVRRRVRTGGAGGTRSTLELLRPISEWPVRPGRYDTPLSSFVSPGRAAREAPSSGAWSVEGSAPPRPARPTLAHWGA